MRTLRATFRLVAGVLVTAGMYGVMKAGLFRRRNHLQQRIAYRNRCFQTWCRVCRGLIGMDLTVEGTPPDPPCVIVTNHLSYVDIIALGTQVRVRFIAKSDVENWPLIGPMVKGVGTIFVDRTSPRDAIRVNRLIRETVEQGDGVLFFPEGTSSGGEAVLPLKSPLLHSCAHARIPIHTATLSYATPAGEPHASRAVCWWGGMTFVSHLVRLLALPGFKAKIVFGIHPVLGQDRKELADKLWSALSQQFHACRPIEETT